MTLCIAAVCQYNDNGADKDAIILCSDFEIGTGEFGSETYQKVHDLGNGWFCMVAGEIARAENLVRRYEDRFDSSQYLREDSFLGPYESFRNYLANEHCASRYGFSYDTVPEWMRERIADEVFSIRTEVMLIIVGFEEAEEPGEYLPIVVSVDDLTGKIAMHETFSVIGLGSAAALSSLHQREYMSSLNLDQAMYCIYEAKRTGEQAHGVGESTSIWVLKPNSKPITADEKTMKALDEFYEKARPTALEDENLRTVKIDLSTFTEY